MFAIGCGGNPPRAKKPAEPAASNKTEDPPPNEVIASPNVAVSMDLAEACNITAGENITPQFQYDRDELQSEDRRVLGTIAKCLTDGALKGRTVSLIGRADPRGTEEYNLALGSRRSNAVSDYLEKQGTLPSQLVETTRGSIDATGRDERGWSKDRRVDIVLVAPKSASR
ncbi:MAG TPA: OmpA family protein [Kofleriaceae bacterium]|nr:OmpA family protein [Kofleriaceae bacterium]